MEVGVDECGEGPQVWMMMWCGGQLVGFLLVGVPHWNCAVLNCCWTVEMHSELYQLSVVMKICLAAW